MSAPSDMARLFEARIIGEEPGTELYGAALRQAASQLDDLAALAKDPATALTVIRWLVDAGVLYPNDEPCDCTQGPVHDEPWDALWHRHFHFVVDHGRGRP